ncbi:unnamed protein product [Angiostrongylus costaricensis]|uniref:Ribosomal protein S7 n=1 Tax=Angiostrongylus costaricensis TaxID=334426 RepID=A0A0R3PFC9_ANGCS|nr:unnamed protein product [Angiostrongylus costaricensis]
MLDVREVDPRRNKTLIRPYCRGTHPENVAEYGTERRQDRHNLCIVPVQFVKRVYKKRMSLIPLTVYDNLRRACCSMFASSSRTDHSAIADRIIANASLVDVLRWRGVSRQFRIAAKRRLSRYTTIHVRVYNDLCKLYERKSSKDYAFAMD